MIIPMKKVTLLCLDHDRENALNELRNIAVMHVNASHKADSPHVGNVAKRLADAEKAHIAVMHRPAKGMSAEHLGGREVTERIVSLLEAEDAALKELDTLERDREILAPWGDFSHKTIETLRKNGVYVYLCAGAASTMDSLPDDVSVSVIKRDPRTVYYAVTSMRELDASSLSIAALPEHSLNEICGKMHKHQESLADISRELDVLSLSKNKVKEYVDELRDELEFVSNRDSMENAESISYITGYVPEPEMANLRAAAMKYGWALSVSDPEPDDMAVPTYIKKPRFMNIIDPLFNFIGISPGYREYDVNIFFLIAFPIFFGLLVGDAGYTMLFIAVALVCKYIFRKKEAARLPLNLLILLSLCGLTWGLLTGSCFGIPRESLPAPMQGLDFLADPAKSPTACELAKKLNIDNPGDMKDKFVQWLCFLIAALHLSSARIFKTVVDIKNWRSWGNLGWALLIWANFFMAVSLVVFPGTFPTFAYGFYAVGLLLIIVTITGEAALNLPFAVIGSFVDVLSYIRLFAVGLSGAYVAMCFNDMGKMAMETLPQKYMAIGVAGLIVIALFGHALNIILGFMGVLVHAIRLNTLEFSNHIEMQWAGIKYRPFAKNTKTDIQKQIE